MHGRMRIEVALAIVAVAILAVWYAFDRPLSAPNWKDSLGGLSYNPSGLYTLRQAEDVPLETIEADFETLAGVTRRVRTYSVSRGLDVVPRVAARHGMKVSLGIWLSKDLDANRDEISRALRIIRYAPARTIDRVFVGNEAVLRGDLTADQVASYMRQVRRGLARRIPVGTAEPWHVWRSYPELADASDFVGAHYLPFWEGAGAETALRDVKRAVAETRVMFWDKPIVLAEVGWPSEGRTLHHAVASGPNQAAFLRRFLAEAKSQGWDYYLIEAFDQPWKVALEGAVGAYWGAFAADRTPKFSLEGNLSALPNWSSLALAAILLTTLTGLVVLNRLTALSFRGVLFLAVGLGALMSGAVAIYHDAALTYATWTTWLAFLIIAPIGTFAALVIMTEAGEMAHALFRRRRRPVIAGNGGSQPFVSVHVPAYNEPPDMMIETLNALARMDYSNFEVIVLDNNTRDPAVWEPVKRHCEVLGTRFRFYHFDNVQGFKAGALNIAMDLTDPRAEVIAVIDSDYQVARDWLRITTPHFADPLVGIVQAPQDYRDARENLFKRMAYEEYAGFFRIGMVERNEDNAIIQHGTMTMMRAHALKESGGWAQWCITEDTELGLRLFERGWKAVYLDQSLGRGVMPDTFGDFKGQRHRWVYGAMQIMKRHWAAISSNKTQLTQAQKYHFVAGWLPWMADALSLAVVLGSLTWTALMMLDSKHFDAPMASLSMVAIALFLVKVGKTFWLYPARVGTGVSGALAASLAGLALSHTVARAVISGLLTSDKPFFRTPKMANSARVLQVLAVAREEALLLSALLVSAVTMLMSNSIYSTAGQVWTIMLAIQALPYAATLIVAGISVWPSAASQKAMAPAAVPASPKQGLAA